MQNSPHRQQSKPTQPRLLTRGFVFLCAATILGYAHHALLTPILPLFIQEQGGTAILVGVITAAFSATSFLLRPFIGHMVDHWSAKGVMIVGTVVLGISSLGYLVYHAVILLLVRAVHGTGWAAYNTGAKVLLSASAPTQRRGETAGYFSMAQGVSTALVPAIALWLLGIVDFIGIFIISSVCGFLAVASSLAVPTWEIRRAVGPKEAFWNNLLERSALLPSILEFLTKATQPAAAIFIPLVAIERGIPVESLMVYYLGYGLVGITARGLFGGLSDRIGRGLIISFGTTTTVVALVITSQAGDIILLTLGGVLFGLGSAAFAPSVMALAIDVAPPERRGAAMATYSMAFQLAQGLGGLLGGILIDTVGYQAMYLTMILAPVAAQVLVFKNRRAISMANLGSPF